MLKYNNFKVASSFDILLSDKQLLELEKLSDYLINYFQKVEFVSDIKDVIANKQICNPSEGWVFFETKDHQVVNLEIARKRPEEEAEMVESIEEAKLPDGEISFVYFDRHKEFEDYIHPDIEERFKPLIDHVQSTTISEELIYFNLGPGAYLPPHVDGIEEDNYYNLIINLRCPNESIIVEINDEKIELGDCKGLFLNVTTDVHAAKNHSTSKDWEFFALRIRHDFLRQY